MEVLSLGREAQACHCMCVELRGHPMESVLSFCQVGLCLLSHVNSLFGGIFENQFLETQLSVGKGMERQKALSLASGAL